MSIISAPKRKRRRNIFESNAKIDPFIYNQRLKYSRRSKRRACTPWKPYISECLASTSLHPSPQPTPDPILPSRIGKGHPLVPPKVGGGWTSKIRVHNDDPLGVSFQPLLRSGAFAVLSIRFT